MIVNAVKVWPVRDGGSPPTSHLRAHSRGAAIPDYAAFVQAVPRLRNGVRPWGKVSHKIGAIFST
jgi:hypothetical protein